MSYNYDAVNITLRMPKKQVERVKKLYESLEQDEVTIQTIYKNILYIGLEAIEQGKVSPERLTEFHELKQIEKLIDFSLKAKNNEGPMWLPLSEIFIYNTNLKKLTKTIMKHRPLINSHGLEKAEFFIGKKNEITTLRVILDQAE